MQFHGFIFHNLRYTYICNQCNTIFCDCEPKFREIDFQKRKLFFSENEGKSVQLQYNDRLDLIALTQQAHHGKLVEDNLPPLGALDVIGKDRRYIIWTFIKKNYKNFF